MSRRRQNRFQERTPRKASAFGLTAIDDKKLFSTSAPYVFFVNNEADRDNIDIKNQYQGLIIEGKRAGYGLAGGGVKDEDSERPDETILREFEGETGLKVIRATPMDQIMVHKLLLIRKKTRRETEKLLRQLLYHGPNRPSVDWMVNAKICFLLENPVPVYKISVQWEGSPAQQLFLQVKENLLESGTTQAEIDRDGLTVNFEDVEDLDPIKDMGLDYREVHEIKGFGLFPVPLILDQLEESEELHSNFRQAKEIYSNSLEPEKVKPVYPEPSLIYYVHMLIIKQAFELKLLAAA